MKLLGLKDKHILITGASNGLGSVCAKALAEEKAHIVLMARSGEKLDKIKESCKDPEKHLSIAVDLTDMQKLQSSITKAKEFLRHIDVVLHVAGGGLGLRDPLLSSSDLIKLITLNLVVAAEINRLVVPEMVERRRGNIVHVASIASSEATGSVGYNTAKAALAAYVRTLGREIAGSGVVVTGILPGSFYTQGNMWGNRWANNPEMLERFIEEKLPRKFLGKADELVPMILLLCSDAASMMGGCLVPIDAGEGMGYLTM